MQQREYYNTMDPNFPEASYVINSYNEITLNSDPNHYSTNFDLYQQYGSSSSSSLLDAADADPQGSSVVAEEYSSSLEDTDFSLSETLKFISQIMMEENVEERPFYDSLSLQVTQQSFYNALINPKETPLSPNQHPLESSDAAEFGTTTTNSPSPDTPVSLLHNHASFLFNSPPISLAPSTTTNLDSSSISNLLAQNIFTNADSISQFNRGLEEASKFLPPQPQLFTGLESSNSNFNIIDQNSLVLKGRKNHHDREESYVKEEGRRSSKQSAVGSSVIDEDDSAELFDKVLLSVQHLSLCNEQQPEQPSERSKIRPKKQGRKKETVDLRTLLLLCSQAVYANDNRTSHELLKQIRQHSSPFGDASQRLAHYFSNGLEARLVGDSTGAQIFYSSPTSKIITAAEFLRAYQVHLSTSPFKKFAYLFANKMIAKAAGNAETLHIIDFGILYGFHWPILIKYLSNRESGPPKLRITGIEFPLPGFRPTERIDDTGRRLANYCKRFNVQFEFNAIATRNWETIKVEDLKIKSNEVVAVNCLMRFKNLHDDESIDGVQKSPRNAVLELIGKIKPDIFAQSIVNGSYNSPFFATRYREALFHFSAIYDMCDTVMERENEWRMMIERELMGREAMNVIACEGYERVERPETYKQWQVRNTRAGFKQLPLDRELMTKFRTKLREWYHTDFVFDEDNNWMLQGWKGRILYGSTCWVPA